MIQIDIDMPETCSDCPLKETLIKEYYCGLMGKFVKGYARYTQRHKDCPLKEVKNNGELL